MPGEKLVLFVFILVVFAPVAVLAQSPSCPLSSRNSWMDNLMVSEVFDNPRDYGWQG